MAAPHRAAARAGEQDWGEIVTKKQQRRIERRRNLRLQAHGHLMIHGFALYLPTSPHATVALVIANTSGPGAALTHRGEVINLWTTWAVGGWQEESDWMKVKGCHFWNMVSALRSRGLLP